MDVLAEVKTIGLWVLSIVAVGVGIALVIIAVMDIYRGLKGSNKDWPTVIKGIAIGIGGALLFGIGGMGVFNLFTQLSISVPGITR